MGRDPFVDFTEYSGPMKFLCALIDSYWRALSDFLQRLEVYLLVSAFNWMLEWAPSAAKRRSFMGPLSIPDLLI